MEKRPRGFSNSLWTLGVPFSSLARTSRFLLDLFISVSISLFLSLSTHFHLRHHWIQATGYQRKTMVNSQLVQWHFKFKCAFLFLLLIFTFQRPQIAASCIMCKFYCCIYKRKWLLCVYSILPRTGFLACFVCLFACLRDKHETLWCNDNVPCFRVRLPVLCLISWVIFVK